MDIGSRIKKIRKELDLTQAEFAARIGSVQNTVTGYESGRRNPSAPVISLICREFRVNEEWLKTGNGEMFSPEVSDELEALAKKYNMSVGEQVFLEKYFKLRKEERDSVFSFLGEVWEGISSTDLAATAPAVPAADLSELSIDEKVALYRQELEREEKVKEKSEALRENA